MEDLAIILLCASLILFIARHLLKKREISWLTLIVSVCGFCAVMIDSTIDDQTMVIAMMPVIFTSLLSALDIMGYGGKR